MKVHLVKNQSIDLFILNNARSKSSFENWLDDLNRADWVRPNDIITTFSNADLLGKGTKRVVFNIGGNNYRMICEYLFGLKKVHLYINWIGTHAEYSKLCKQYKQYTVNKY